MKNGILPVRLPDATAAAIRSQLHAKPGSTLTVDLPEQKVTDVEGHQHAFDIDGFSKRCLLEGASQIDLTLRRLPEIEAFEARYRDAMSWA